MTPLDPVQTAKSDRQLHLGPDYLDENPNLELVNRGREVADDEARDDALLDDPEAQEHQALEEEGDVPPDPMTAPELAAMHVDPMIVEEEEADEER